MTRLAQRNQDRNHELQWQSHISWPLAVDTGREHLPAPTSTIAGSTRVIVQSRAARLIEEGSMIEDGADSRFPTLLSLTVGQPPGKIVSPGSSPLTSRTTS
jgi:hypothetical protein